MPDNGLRARIEDAIGITKEVMGLVEQFREPLAQLVSMPAAALQGLDAALAEIDKTFAAVDAGIAEHLAIALSPDSLSEDRALAVRLTGPELPAQVERDRGHCHEILRVYDRYLSGALDRLLAPDRARDARWAFQRLGSADGDLFEAMTGIAETLRARAEAALKEQLSGGEDAAQAAFQRDADQLVRLRKELLDARQALVVLRNGFMRQLSSLSLD